MTSTVDPHTLAPDEALTERASAPDRARDHLETLRGSVRSLATRAGGDETERWLLRAGAILVPFGFVAILAGYWGAAHAGRVIQQIPYQISGGILGLALVFAGAFSYFAYWLTRILRAQQRVITALDEQTQAIVGELRSLRDQISAAPAAAVVPTAGGAAPAVTAADGGAAGTLVATPKGSLVHLGTCPVVAGRDDLRPVEVIGAGDRPCKVCAPVSNGST
jgi:hypothetical protein